MADPVDEARAALGSHLDTIAAWIADSTAKTTDVAAAQQRKIESLEAELGDYKTRLATSVRMQERFRYALFVYLQERDGPAGRNAPTNETLALIRDLLENRQVDS